MAFILHGIAVSGGIAIGRAHLIAPAALEVAHYLVPLEHIEAEVHRFDDAVATVVNELYSVESELPADSPPEFAALLELHRLILQDPLLSEEPQNLIRERRYNAEWALTQQLQAAVAQFEEIEDEYIAARRADVAQVVERVLKVLTGTAGDLGLSSPGDDVVIIAHDIAPADMMQFKKRVFGGFATDLGGATSHTAIVARSLDIPAVVGVGNAARLIQQDELVIIDGDAGVIIAEPSAIILEEYRHKRRHLELQRDRLKRLRYMPARTLDDAPIELHANIELPSDCAMAVEVGATGVGLYRTEFLFMNRSGQLPDEEEQYLAYRSVIDAMGGAPVTIRTLDVGADKSLDGEAPVDSGNPALGLRAIRYCLSEPQMFLTQLRAILRASAHGATRLLLPMLAHVQEIDQTHALLDQARAQLVARKQDFDPAMPVGGMIEIPAAALSLSSFVKRLDFLSIGTNDLIQYTLAIDRTDNAVAHLYDPLHPAVLHLVAHTISVGHRANLPVAVCGEMAGDARLTRLLLGLGLREFSMHPAQMLSVKQEVLLSDLTHCQAVAKKVLASGEPQRIRALVAGLARGTTST
jgi:phosphotransferase system enzyme I (PtsI)